MNEQWLLTRLDRAQEWEWIQFIKKCIGFLLSTFQYALLLSSFFKITCELHWSKQEVTYHSFTQKEENTFPLVAKISWRKKICHPVNFVETHPWHWCWHLTALCISTETTAFIYFKWQCSYSWSWNSKCFITHTFTNTSTAFTFYMSPDIISAFIFFILQLTVQLLSALGLKMKVLILTVKSNWHFTVYKVTDTSLLTKLLTFHCLQSYWHFNSSFTLNCNFHTFHNKIIDILRHIILTCLQHTFWAQASTSISASKSMNILSRNGGDTHLRHYVCMHVWIMSSRLNSR